MWEQPLAPVPPHTCSAGPGAQAGDGAPFTSPS